MCRYSSSLLDVLDRISRTLCYMLKPTYRQPRRKSRRISLFPRDAKIPVGRRVKNDVNFSTVKTPRRGDLVATRNHIYYIYYSCSIRRSRCIHHIRASAAWLIIPADRCVVARARIRRTNTARYTDARISRGCVAQLSAHKAKHWLVFANSSVRGYVLIARIHIRSRADKLDGRERRN